MKLLSLQILLLLCTLNLSGQKKAGFSFRIGVTGTGYSQERLWLFNDQSITGTQNFEFGNSWGLVVDVDYHLATKWRIGLHTIISQTSLNISLPSASLLKLADDHTTQNQLVAEVKFLPLKDPNWQPFIGLNGGFLLTRDIELNNTMNEDQFVLASSPICGLTLGLDYFIDSRIWAIHFIMRSQSANYVLDQSGFTQRQNLFTRNWWSNFSHWQVGITRTF